MPAELPPVVVMSPPTGSRLSDQAKKRRARELLADSPEFSGLYAGPPEKLVLKIGGSADSPTLLAGRFQEPTPYDLLGSDYWLAPAGGATGAPKKDGGHWTMAIGGGPPTCPDCGGICVERDPQTVSLVLVSFLASMPVAQLEELTVILATLEPGANGHADINNQVAERAPTASYLAPLWSSESMALGTWVGALMSVAAMVLALRADRRKAESSLQEPRASREQPPSLEQIAEIAAAAACVQLNKQKSKKPEAPRKKKASGHPGLPVARTCEDS